MKEEFANERQREADDEKIDIQEVLFKYIIHWPWFVGAVLVCLIGAWIYLRMATPVYNISATVLIKDDKKGGNTGGMAGLEELGLSGLISSSQNIDNETILSPYYWLQQNDVVYVTPNKAKARNSDIGNSTSLWFSATSILVSLASLLFNILK